MNNQDFRSIILKQQEQSVITGWNGQLIEYLEKVKKNPKIANVAPARIYNMIMKYGTTPMDDSVKTRGYEDLVWYNFFDDKLYGNRTAEAIHDLMKFLKAASKRTETGKRILILVGPVASAKSTIATLIKKGLEMDDTPKFAIQGCPLHEEPLHAIPLEHREFWMEQLGVKIEGDLCPVCSQMVEDKFTENGKIKWHEIPVESIRFSENKRIGIGTFQPSDPKSQDVSELIGSVNIGKLDIYGEGDPRAFQFDGELEIANGGMVEYIEILKADVKFHYILITAAQEQKIKAPRFPQMYVDTLILSHTNQTEYDSFASERKNEALHDRMYMIRVPWNDRVNDEIKIYEKMIADSEFSDIHVSPGALKVAAEFAILTRLYESPDVNLIKKMKLYNGEYLEEFSKGREIDVKKLREEGRKNGECETGVSVRFIMNALNICMGQKDDNVKCITALDMIRALRNNFQHVVGVEEKDQHKYIDTLLMGEKDSIVSEYKEFAKEEVNLAFVHAFDEQANELYKRYILNAKAYCKNETILDEVTGEYIEPDEKIMRALEELVPVPKESKKEFRQGIFVFMNDVADFDWRSYKPLADSIKKKLMNDLKNVVTLSIADTTVTDDKATKKRNKAMQTLLDKGYCEYCAKQLLNFVGEILRREN